MPIQLAARLALLLCLFALAGCGGGIHSLRAPAVMDVRLGGEATTPRLVIDIGGRASYDVFTLSGPDRLVVDLEGVRWMASRTGAGRSPVISGYRSGEPRSGVNRLVLDLTQAVEVTNVFVLPGLRAGYSRLVVDVRALGRGAAGRENRFSGALGSASPAGQRYAPKSGRPRVLIDPGHGGKDPGAIGPSGVREKDVILPISLKLAEELRRRGIDVVMTRDTDRFISLGGRAAAARQSSSDLLISIHADANRRKDIQGVHFYYNGRGGAPKESVDFARRLLVSLGERTNIIDNPIRDKNFAVLRTAGVPAVLVEVGFLTNAYDERRLRESSYQRLLAQGIAEAVQLHFR